MTSHIYNKYVSFTRFKVPVGGMNKPHWIPSVTWRLTFFVVQDFALSTILGCSYPAAITPSFCQCLHFSSQFSLPTLIVSETGRHSNPTLRISHSIVKVIRSDHKSMQRDTSCLSQHLILCLLGGGLSAPWGTTHLGSQRLWTCSGNLTNSPHPGVTDRCEHLSVRGNPR